MSELESSKTGLLVAVSRAVHQLLDDEPKILDDPPVLRLIAPAAIERIRSAPDSFRTPRQNALRARVVVRSRYAEDRLKAAVERGIRQYVILGAGLDSFAYRQPDWAHALQIFEVDQPASQQTKRERLAAGRVAIPANVHFVSVDFESTDLRTGLGASPFDPNQAVFLSWLGVMVYLSAEAVDQVFRFAASLPPSSELVFTFAGPPTAGELLRPEISLAGRAASHGEPWLTRVRPGELVKQLYGIGFSTVKLLTPSEIDEQYIRGRQDGLQAPRRSFIASAIV